MINWRSFISAVIGVCFCTSFVHADIIPVSNLDGRKSVSKETFTYNTTIHNTKSSTLYESPFTDNLDLWSVEFSADNKTNVVNHTSDLKPPVIRTNKPGSLNLCLSALISLSLCSSIHLMKKHSLGFIPEWYHNGGPQQIGHSFAVTPDFLRTTQIYCFFQPDYSVQDTHPKYLIEEIVSLIRKSQFKSTVLTSRPPPITCHKQILSHSL